MITKIKTFSLVVFILLATTHITTKTAYGFQIYGGYNSFSGFYGGVALPSYSLWNTYMPLSYGYGYGYYPYSINYAPHAQFYNQSLVPQIERLAEQQIAHYIEEQNPTRRQPPQEIKLPSPQEFQELQLQNQQISKTEVTLEDGQSVIKYY